MIEALVFDLDGTLANSEDLHFMAWKEVLEQHGAGPFSFDIFQTYIGTSNERVGTDYIRRHGWQISLTDLIREKQEVYMGLIPRISLCTGAREILERFYGNKILALASSSHEKEVLKILETHGLLKYFQAIVCGDMVSERKPHPEIYLTACSKIGVIPGKALAFEDSGPGLLAAKNAGMVGIAIPNAYTKDHDFSRADRLITDLDQVDRDFLAAF